MQILTGKQIQGRELMKKRFCAVVTLILAFSFCITSLGNEKAEDYFPSTLGSYWIYEDQNGKELKRTAKEGEEIAGKVYQAFNYEPELKDWVNYIRFMHPELFNVNDKGITLTVKEGAQEAVKARLNKEIDFLFNAALQEGIQDNSKPTINITAEADEDLQLLLTSIQPNEEWDVFKIKANLEVLQDEEEQGKADFTIIETGMVLGTDTVETSVGTFEDCLKVQYQTETTVVMNPAESEFDPPGETVTTIWFAPNVGIVKIHQKVGNMFLDMLPKEEGLPFIIPQPKETTLELKKYQIKAEDSTITIPSKKDEKTLEKRVEETAKNIDETLGYFPSTVNSYWIYEDKDGKELKRTVIDGEEIAGKDYNAFNYEPEVKDLVNFSRFIRPELFEVSNKGITFFVKDNVEKAVEERLNKEMKFLFDTIAAQEGFPSNSITTFNTTVEAEERMQILLTPIVNNEEWDVIRIKVNLEVKENDEVLGTVDYTIIETGLVLGTEKVETAAGTFQDCLKVKYQTETKVIFQPDETDLNPPGETVTTVWYAPNVGIVKIHQKSGNMFLDMIPEDEREDYTIPPARERILELKKFDIKAVEVNEKENN